MLLWEIGGDRFHNPGLAMAAIGAIMFKTVANDGDGEA